MLKKKEQKETMKHSHILNYLFTVFFPLQFHSKDSNEFYECKVSAIGFSVETSKFMATLGITDTDNA